MWSLLFLLLFATGLSGCGNVTAGGLAETTVYISGGEDASSASHTSADALLPILSSNGVSAGAAQASAEELDGTVRVRLRVLIRRQGGFWKEMTRDEQEVEVAAEGAEPQEVTSVELQPGLYDRVRVVFTYVSVDVRRGPEFDDSGPFVGEVEVELAEGDEIEVEEELLLLLQDRERVDLLVKLRARSWVALSNAAEPARRVVLSNVFRDAVTIRYLDPN